MEEVVKRYPEGPREALSGGTHLEQPWLELLIDHDVVAVHLEAVLVVDHHVLACLERVHDGPPASKGNQRRA